MGQATPFADIFAGLETETALAVGVSGGPDSMALCWMLAQWRAALARGPTLHALTVDHGLRPEASAEALQVGGRLRAWDHVHHYVLTLDQKPGAQGLMAWARQARYRAMADHCCAQGIGTLLLAHHQDDQAETFLLRLAKGSGLDGLSAMRRVQRYDDGLRLVRPLLAMTKQELIVLCKAQDIPFVEDPTNENPQFARNRLRQAQAVLAEEGLSSKRLAVTASRMARARAALEYFTAQAWDGALRGRDEQSLQLDFAALDAQPEEIRLRVLLHALDYLSTPEREEDGYGPRREKMEELVYALFDGDTPFPRRSLGGFLFSRQDKKGLIVIEKEKKPAE